VTSVVQEALWAVLFTLAMSAVGKAVRRQSAASTGQGGRHGTVVLVTGLVTGLPFLAGAVAAAIFAGKDRWVSLVFLAFSSPGAYLVWEWRVVRFPGTARWADLVAADSSPSMKWVTMTLRDGQVLRVSAMLLGLEPFIATLVAQAGHPIVPAARATFEATASGQRPSISE
jgi:hypothetical protein